MGSWAAHGPLPVQRRGPVYVEERPIGSIRPYENNPRLNDAAVDAVAASIREFGFTNPVLIAADDTIIAGHSRILR